MNNFYKYIKEKRGEGVDKASIFLHDSPDPDAMGSALGIQDLLSKENIACNIYYDGEINHTQNKAMINVLNIDMIKISDIEEENIESHKEFINSGITIVIDTYNFCEGNCKGPSKFFDKDSEIIPNVVIDHHTVQKKIKDNPDISILEQCGSCSTIVADIILSKDKEIDSRISTALYMGLMSDTDNLNRKDVILEKDREIHDILKQKIDLDLFMRIFYCPKPRILIELEGFAKNKFFKHKGNCVVSGVGFIKSPHRSLIGEIGDNFMRYDGVETVVVLAIVDDGIGEEKMMVASFRNNGDIVDAQEFIRKVFGRKNGGGRKGTAGASIDLSDVLKVTIDNISGNIEKMENIFKIIYESYASKIFSEIEISS